MNCNQTHNCNCNQDIDLGCQIKDQSTDCSIYTGDNLECSGIEKGTILTQVIQRLDKFICKKFNEVSQFFSITNIGLGAEVYKGDSNIGEKQLRTLVSSDNSVAITQNEDEIDIITSIEGQNVGEEAEVFKQKNESNLEFRTLQGTGGTTVSVVGDVVEINSSRVASGEANTNSNVGNGEGIFKQKVGVDNELKTLVAGLGINITSTESEIQIESSQTQGEEQIERTSSFSLDASMDSQVIFANATGVTAIDITVPSGLPDNFKCGVIRQGTAPVNFVSTQVTLNTATGNSIELRYQQGFIQKRNLGTEEFILLGNLV